MNRPDIVATVPDRRDHRQVRLEFLDSLRGWAAFYVVLYHTALLPQPSLQVPEWAKSVVLTGGTGVTLFFVASAFSLCQSARPSSSGKIGLASFAVRRLFRIAPLFYVVLAVSLCRDWLVFSVTHTPLEILINASFIFNIVPGYQTGIVWASWTVGVEVLFYAVFPLLFVRTRTVIAAAILLIFTMIILQPLSDVFKSALEQPVAFQIFGQFSVLHQLPVFAFGILAFRLYVLAIGGRRIPPQLGSLFVLIAVYLYGLLLYGMLPQFPFFDTYYWQPAIYTLLILGLSISPIAIVVNQLSIFVGRISYSVYLLHPIVIYQLIPVYRFVYEQNISCTISFFSCVLVTLVSILPLACLAFWIVEAPAIRIGRRIARRVERPTPQF